VTRVLVAGLGDTGVLCAGALASRSMRRRGLSVTGVSPTTGLVSGQELGLRLTRPDSWSRDYRIPYRSFRRLDRVDVVHGRLTSADLLARTVSVVGADGVARELGYDVLVVATGVANGFWRSDAVRDDAAVATDLADRHARLAAAGSVAVVGGGAAAVGAAYNLAVRWPGKQVDLYFPGERGLPQHHGRTWAGVRRRLEAAGVALHPGHRAVLPGSDEPCPGPVTWSTGQAPAQADLVLWAVGRVRPHTGWLPASVLDEHGFVRTGSDLRVPGVEGVFAIGDVAATDPLRSTARNFQHTVLAANVAAYLEGRPLREISLPGRRWGSVLGPQRTGLEVFNPAGRPFRIPRVVVDRALQPWVVKRGIYGGVRR
jgi:NADH dehydrogenase FAD-containing subunit